MVLVSLLVVTSCGKSDGSLLSQDETTEQIETSYSESTENKDDRIVSAINSGTPTLVVSNVEARKGDKVSVAVNIVNNPGILGMTLILSYDENSVSLTDVKNGDAFKGVVPMSFPKQLSSGCSFMWSGEKILENQIHDGTALVLEFKIKDDAKVGKTPIVLLTEKEGIYDKDLTKVILTIQNGYLTISP